MSTTVFAGESGEKNIDEQLTVTNSTNNASNYFEFISKQRITDTGEYEFNFTQNLVSQHFKVSKTETLIRAKATSTKNNDTYYIAVRNAETLEEIADIPYKADGQWHSHTFKGLEVGVEYELEFRNNLNDYGKFTINGIGTIGNFVK